MPPNNTNTNQSPVTPTASPINVSQSSNIGTPGSGTPLSTKNNPIILIAAALVICIIAFLWSTNKDRNAVKSTLQETAESGEIVSEFPRQLIVKSDAVIINSKAYVATAQEQSANVTTVTYTTKATANDLFTTYLANLKRNGYTITKSVAADNGTGSIRGDIEINELEQVVSVNISDTPEHVRRVHIVVTKNL
jgi:hypothetical protein